MNRLWYSKVYLEGPMDFADDRGEGWRSSLTPFLRSKNIGILDPTNKATYYGHEDIDHLEERKKIIEGIKSGNVLADTLFDRYHGIMKDVVGVDLRMVDTADFIILYVNLDIYACGTFHENAMAILQRKPTIVMVEQGKVYCPPWLIGVVPHRMIFDKWENVKNYITYIDSAEKIDTLNRWRIFDYRKVYNVEA